MNQCEMEKFEKMFDDKLEESNKKIIDELQRSVGIQLSQYKDYIEAKIKESELNLTKLFNNELSERDRKIESLETRLAETLQQHEESKEIERKKCNIVINGIPYNEEENINAIYKTISSQLGFESPPTANVYRMPGIKSAKPAIIIRLVSELHVDKFMSRYYKVSTQLKLNAFDGFEGNHSRVYISEDLSTNQYNIFKQAMSFLRSKHVLNIRKKSGSVLVQINKETRHRSYKSVDDLKSDVTNNNKPK